MDWIYYHEVMSEFSLHHWAELSTVDGFCKGPLAIRPTNNIIDDPIVRHLNCHITRMDVQLNLVVGC